MAAGISPAVAAGRGGGIRFAGSAAPSLQANLTGGDWQQKASFTFQFYVRSEADMLRTAHEAVDKAFAK